MGREVGCEGATDKRIVVSGRTLRRTDVWGSVIESAR